LNTKARLLGLRHGMTRVEVDTFVGPIVLARSLQVEKATKAVLLDFKVKYLAAFTCAILNNQPMGFYMPAVLVTVGNLQVSIRSRKLYFVSDSKLPLDLAIRRDAAQPRSRAAATDHRSLAAPPVSGR
jgi:hypothetical protein